jgi:kynurenine formamidase
MLGKPLQLGCEDWPDQTGLSTETVSLTSHTGTHVDAPMHYGPYCEGMPSKTIDELPLDWFFQDGVVLHCLGDANNGPVTLAEVRTACAAIPYQIKERDIVLIRTGADALWGRSEYFTNFRGMSVEAVEWLLSLGVKVLGIDSFGFDPPFVTMLDRFAGSRDKRHLWPTHILGRSREYCQIERLANLDKLPCSSGFKVACFPVKIRRAGAGWVRAVAIYESEQD